MSVPLLVFEQSLVQVSDYLLNLRRLRSQSSLLHENLRVRLLSQHYLFGLRRPKSLQPRLL